jgi:hypothetical protein
MDDILRQLSAPFDPRSVHWRPGSMTKDKKKTQALAYLDARDVMARLDGVCGAMWQCQYTPMPNGSTCASIGILIDGHWVWRSNGAGETKVEGEKGGYSDAMKRAAVLWGVGRYLYAIRSPWVLVDEYKQILPQEMAKLRNLLDKSTVHVEKPPLQLVTEDVPKGDAWAAAMQDLKNAIPGGRIAVERCEDGHRMLVQAWPDSHRSDYAEAYHRALTKALEVAA